MAAQKLELNVMIEGQEGLSELTGGRVAAPIARAVIEASLRPMPAPPAPTTTTTTPAASTTAPTGGT